MCVLAAILPCLRKRCKEKLKKNFFWLGLELIILTQGGSSPCVRSLSDTGQGTECSTFGDPWGHLHSHWAARIAYTERVCSIASSIMKNNMACNQAVLASPVSLQLQKLQERPWTAFLKALASLSSGKRNFTQADRLAALPAGACKTLSQHTLSRRNTWKDYCNPGNFYIDLIFEAEGNKSLIPGRLARSQLTCPSTRKVRDESVVSLCSERYNASTGSPWPSGPKRFDRLFSICNRQLADSPGG